MSVPTAAHADAVGQDTLANSPPGSPVCGTGMDSTFQLVAFQDSEKGVLRSMVPTAVHAVAVAHDTAERALYPKREGLDVRWIVHAAPFHRSASVAMPLAR